MLNYLIIKLDVLQIEQWARVPDENGINFANTIL
jgi:hypothetical protein